MIRKLIQTLTTDSDAVLPALSPIRQTPSGAFKLKSGDNRPEVRRRRIPGAVALAGLALLLALAGCSSESVVVEPDASLTESSATVDTGPAATALPPTDAPSPEPTATVGPTDTPAPTSTPDPYADVTIAGLSEREYGEGELQVREVMAVTDAFTRTLVSYPSDGLEVYGFINTPPGPGPFPVILVLHGYVNPSTYRTLAYTSRYADSLAREGFIAIHPNYRNHPPSESGDDFFRTGYAIDVLNLLAIVDKMAGQPGPLAKAEPDATGLWGHSMGGGITIRTITVSDRPDAAVLYGSMSADERANYERILMWSEGESGHEELAVGQSDLERIAPLYHLDRIDVPVSIHHGSQDASVPPQWSQNLCERLQSLDKTVTCHEYPGQPHTFVGAGDQEFQDRVVAFFRDTLGTD